MAASDDGLRLLSLGEIGVPQCRDVADPVRIDGGGIRGLSELIILDEFMKRIQHDEGLPVAPLPCEYFDLIGGTGTGGYVANILLDLLVLTFLLRVIAIMLGRLRMPVSEAIAMYARFGKEVFSERKRKTQEGNFKASNLIKAIKRIVATASGTRDENELMMAPGANDPCKVYVRST